MTTQTTIPSVPLPAGAVRAYDWDPPEVTGYPDASRYFVGTTRSVDIEQCGENVEVSIDGHQWSDGRVDRLIRVGQLHPDDPITAAQALDLAKALMEAAVELHQLNSVRGDEGDESQAR